ncbi:MAG: thioredoxin family protein [Dehalococcoidales bacterium]|nr:thioredoxin family protein [Dehalococcoidales bacterium]
MIKIKIFGSTPPCVKCKELERRATNVAGKYPDQVEVTKLDVFSAEGDKYGIMLTPAMVINDKIVSAGKLIPEEEIEKAVKREQEV